MAGRRAIGLRIVTGIVGFDVVVLKLLADSAARGADPGQIAWAMRLVAAGALVVATGMLVQIEVRNRNNRQWYRTAERQLEAMRCGQEPPVDPIEETFWETVRNAWATTWPLAGIAVLTAVTWWLAGPLTAPVR